MSQQKHVLSLYALPDGGDYNAAEIDSPDWESSVLYENDQAKNAYNQMTHAVAWAILGDFSDGYAVAYWELDKEGYSACVGIRTIKCSDQAGLEVDEAKLAKLNEDVLNNLMNGPIYIEAGVRWVQRTRVLSVLEQLTRAGSEVLARLRSSQAKVHELTEQLTPGSLTERAPTQWAYEQACAALEKHRQRADAAEAPKWIAVSERLPEPPHAGYDYSVRVLAFGEPQIDGPFFVAYASLNGDGRWYLAHDNQPVMRVTHWQTLPAEPA